MARGRPYRSGGRKIDFKQWNAAPGLISSIGSDATILGGGLAFTFPATLLRFRGYVSAMLDETQQVGDLIVVTFGLAIITSDAFTAGSGSVPDPATEPEFPWIWWKEMRLDSFATLTTAIGPAGYGPASQRYEVDSKAMRKIKPGETLCMIIQTTNAAGAPATLLDIGQLRVLIGT